MNAKIPELTNQLDSLVNAHQEAMLELAQAPDKYKVQIETRVIDASVAIDAFFETNEADINTLYEQRELKVSEIFDNPNLTNDDVEKLIKEIDSSPEFELLFRARDLGRLVLSDFEIVEIEEPEEIKNLKSPILDFSKSQLEQSGELDEEEIELALDISKRTDFIETELDILPEPEVDIATELQVEEVDFEPVYEALESDPELEVVLAENQLEDQELFLDYFEEEDEEDEPSFEPEILDITGVLEYEPIEEEAVTELESPTISPEIEISEEELIAPIEAALFIEAVEQEADEELKDVAFESRSADNIRESVSPEELEVNATDKADKINKVLTILENIQNPDELIDAIDNVPAMYDFIDHIQSVRKNPRWKALIQKVSDSNRAKMTQQENEKSAKKVIDDVVDNALVQLEQGQDLFENEISLSDLASQTNIKTEHFYELYQEKMIEVSDQEKRISVNEIKLSTEEAMLLLVHANNPELLTKASNETREKIKQNIRTKVESARNNNYQVSDAKFSLAA